MINIILSKDRSYIATRNDGKEVRGILDEQVYEVITDIINNTKTKEEETIKDIITHAPDEVILENKSYIDEIVWDKEYKKNDLILFNNIVYRVIQDHTADENYNPEDTNYRYVSLKDKINPDNPDEIMEFKQPQGYQDAYQKGDKVKFEGNIHVSKIDGNTWSPAQAPQHWEVIE